MSEIRSRITQLKREKNALILVHYYQAPEIHEIADFMGDSFDLSRRATTTDARLIVFCGVHFMAESAAILNPGKKVVLPAFDAGCPMADTATAESVRAARRRYPDAGVVCYMNTSAEVKAESDIVCTSSNAVKIVNSLTESRVLFVPDANLGDFVARHSNKEIIRWPGHCYVHTRFLAPELRRSRELLPNAKVVVHPECSPDIRDLADHVCSTSGMITYVADSPATEFIIGTEMGLIDYLKRHFPEKRFYAAPPGSTCFNMKKNTLEQVLEALDRELPVVTVPDDLAGKAKRALDRMLEVGK